MALVSRRCDFLLPRGRVSEYVLPYAEIRPRRITITSDDIIWYSDYGRGALGRFDPKTGKAREWPSPGGSESGLAE